MAALLYFGNNFQDEPREFAALGVLAPCEFAECAWSSPGERMRARSNELTVKSQRNWMGWGGCGGKVDVQTVDADEEKGAHFLRIANFFTAVQTVKLDGDRFSSRITNWLQQRWDFPTVKHTDKLLLVVSQASFVPSFSASPLRPLLLCGSTWNDCYITLSQILVTGCSELTAAAYLVAFVPLWLLAAWPASPASSSIWAEPPVERFLQHDEIGYVHYR